MKRASHGACTNLRHPGILSRQARAKGILTEEDLERYLGE